MADIFRDRLLTNSQIHFTYGASSWDEIDGILVPWGPFLFSEWTEQYFRSFCPGIRFVQSPDGIAFFWEGFPFNGNKPNCALWRTDILTNVALNFAKKKNKLIWRQFCTSKSTRVKYHSTTRKPDKTRRRNQESITQSVYLWHTKPQRQSSRFPNFPSRFNFRMALRAPLEHPQFKTAKEEQWQLERFSIECRKKFRVWFGFALLSSVIG